TPVGVASVGWPPSALGQRTAVAHGQWSERLVSSASAIASSLHARLHQDPDMGEVAGGPGRRRPVRPVYPTVHPCGVPRRQGGCEMQIGACLPPGEFGADIAALRAYVQAVQDLNYRHLVSGDHVLGADPSAFPGWRSPYTNRMAFHEPFVLFG